MKNTVELVGKIGSMALIDREQNDIDYNKFARIGRELEPGMIWVSSGATEIGRLDYIKRGGAELKGGGDSDKTDYASQGQAILMQTYRNFIDSRYSVRQLLVEHSHFNNEEKREHIKNFLLRCLGQNAIPIINYNDAVSFEETRKMEINGLRSSRASVVELVDNDETAAQIACLTGAKTLLILTGVDGIYRKADDPATLISEISGRDAESLTEKIEECKKLCVGASRAGANGAAAKLEYIKAPAVSGTHVIIGNAKYGIKKILSGEVACTRVFIK